MWVTLVDHKVFNIKYLWNFQGLAEGRVDCSGRTVGGGDGLAAKRHTEGCGEVGGVRISEPSGTILLFTTSVRELCSFRPERTSWDPRVALRSVCSRSVCSRSACSRSVCSRSVDVDDGWEPLSRPWVSDLVTNSRWWNTRSIVSPDLDLCVTILDRTLAPPSLVHASAMHAVKLDLHV